MVDDDEGGYGEDPAVIAGIGDNKPPTYEEELRLEHKPLFLRLEAMELERGKLPAIINTDEDLEAAGKFIIQARGLAKDAGSAHKKASAVVKEKAKTCDKVFLTNGLVGTVDQLKAVVQALADDYTERKAAANRLRLLAEADALREKAGERAYEAVVLQEAGSHRVAEVVTSQVEHLDKAADKLETRAEGGTATVVRTKFEDVTASGRTVPAYELLDIEAVDLNLFKGLFFEHEIAQIFQRYADRNKGAEDASVPGLRVYQKTISTFR